MTNSIVGIRECPQEPANRMAFVLAMALSQGSQTFGDLWPTANRAAGYDAADHNAPGYRFTDGWLQRGRRKGWLQFERSGNRVLWTLTSAGRDEFVGQLADATQKDPLP